MAFHAINPFQPPQLPPEIDFRDPGFFDLLVAARAELAELKGVSLAVPNAMLLISPSVIKESLSSSEIENIHTTIVEVLQSELFPEPERREPDKEVLRYREGLLWGAANLKTNSISTRLILGIHERLLKNASGEYRKIQNKIQNDKTKEVLYTPPIASEIPKLISNWENFVNRSNDHVDPLIKCAIAHYQFEAIHPFEDGNGRTGRILMVLQLLNAGVLGSPILYISGYLEEKKPDYYRLLRDVTARGNWKEYIQFMLRGFAAQAKTTKEMALKILELLDKTKASAKKGHAKIYSSDLIEHLFSFPVTNPARASKELNIHYTTATRHLSELAKGGLLKERKVGKYHLYINHQLLSVLKA